MKIISSRTDIRAWVSDNRGDVYDLGLTDELVDAIQASDHPPYGSDWSAWLAEHVPALVETLPD